MPVFNCSRTIAEAICSILDQTYKDWELLIIDDGSTDATLKIALSFDDPRIIVVGGGQNKRIAARLNQCVSMARGRFFARMDGDDIAYPRRLECQLEYLYTHPKVDLVAGWVVVFRSDGTILGARRGLLTHDEMWAHPWKGVLMPHSTWMGRIEWFRRDQYRSGTAVEDQDLLYRTYQKSQFATVPQLVLGYREDKLSLIYLLRQRWHAYRHILPNAIQQREFTNAALCIVGEAAKGLTETVAILTGLNHRLLRRRAMPILGDEAGEWHSVWEEVRRAAGSHRCLSEMRVLS